MTTSTANTTQPTIWLDVTAEAQVNDIIRKPFCPIARVLSKEILEDGRTCLLVTFPACRDHDSEEWMLPAVEILPDTTPAPICENNKLPNRGNSGRRRVQSIIKTDKALAAIFKDRPKQYQQFLIVQKELTAIGIKVGKLINSRSNVKGWQLNWDGDKAGLFWTVGNGWEISSLKCETELTGNWEGFDLIEQLACNGIDLESEDE